MVMKNQSKLEWIYVWVIMPVVSGLSIISIVNVRPHHPNGHLTKGEGNILATKFVVLKFTLF